MGRTFKFFLLLTPVKEATEGGKRFVYRNTITAADVTIGVCIVQLLEF